MHVAEKVTKQIGNESKNCQEMSSDLFMPTFPDLHNFNTCNLRLK